MNPITILLLGGVALLLINIIYGIVHARRGQLKAGWLTVSIALVACALIGIGSVARIVSPVNGFPTGGNRGNRPGNVAGSANSGASTDPTASTTDGLSPTLAAQSDSNTSTEGLRNISAQGNIGRFQQDGQSNGSGNAAGATTQTDPVATNESPSADSSTPDGSTRGNRGGNRAGTASDSANSSATGNAGVSTESIAVQGNSSASGGNTNPASTPTGNRRFRQGGQNSGSASGAASNQTDPAANGLAAVATPANNAGFNQGVASDGATNNTSGIVNPNDLPLSVQINRFGPQIAVAGAVLGIIFALVLYRIEKKRTGFTASSSRGLLNAGAGAFMIVAALVVPIIPTELGAGATTQPGRAFARAAAAVTRVAVTATPSPTPLPTSTPTLLPTFTPVMTEMPIELPTEIAYASVLPTATPTTVPDCTVTANNNLNLRSDPSTDNIALGKAPIPTGSVLPVIGKSKDGKWWQVTYYDGTVDWTGWVSAAFAKAGSKCSTVPVTQ